MPVVKYGIEIDTKTTIDDSVYGLFNGQLRYVTGQQDYRESVLMDKSGNGHDFLLSGGSLSDYDGFVFDGVDDRAVSDVNATSGATSIDVYLNYRTTTVSGTQILVDNSESSPNKGFRIEQSGNVIRCLIYNSSTTESIILSSLTVDTDYRLEMHYTASSFTAKLNDVEYTGTPITIDASTTNVILADGFGEFKLYELKIIRNGSIIVDVEGKDSTQYLYGDNSEIYLSLSGSETFANSIIVAGQIYNYTNTSPTKSFKAVGTPKHGQVITLTSTNDTSDNYFGGVKGAALAVGDMFEFENPTGSSVTARYLGLNYYKNGFIEAAGKSVRNTNFETFGDLDFNNSMSFSFKNDDNLYDIFTDYGIFLENKRVKAFAIIDDVCYQYYQGVIKNVKPNENVILFNATSDFKKYFDDLPSEKFTVYNYPDLTKESNYGKYIPIAIGDIPKGIVYNTTQRTDDDVPFFQVRSISADGKGCTARIVSGDTTGLPFPGPVTDPIYFRIKYGNTTDDTKCESPNTDKIYRVLSYTFISGPNYGDFVFTFDKAFEEGTVANINTYGISDLNFHSTSWWGELYSISSSYVGANNDIEGYSITDDNLILYDYDSNKKKYSDITSAVETSTDSGDSDNPKPYISTVLTDMTANGEYKTVTPLSYRGDRDRATTFKLIDFVDSGGGDFAWYTTDIAITPNAIELSKNSTDIYIGVDFIQSIVSAISNDTMDIHYFAYPYVATTDGLKIRNNSDVINVTFQNLYTYASGSSTYKVAFLPDDFYKNDGDPSAGYVQYSNYSYSGTGNRPISSFLKLSSEAVQNFKDGLFTHVRIFFEIKTNIGNNIDTTPPSRSNISITGAGLYTDDSVNLLEDNLYSNIFGEKKGSDTSDSVYDSFRLILENYCNIPPDLINYENLQTKRGLWHVGRQIINQENALSIIKSLCNCSFVAGCDSVDGGFKFSAWIDDSTPLAPYYYDGVIERDTIKSLPETPITKIYNLPTINYGYEKAIDDYKKQHFVKNVDQSAFPTSTATDANGNLLWKQWVGGIENDYSLSKLIWELFNEAYNENQSLNEMPEKNSNVKWFIDTSLLNKTSTISDASQSPWLMLYLLGIWTARKKRPFSFEVPINNYQIVRDLLESCNFKDYIYTNDDIIQGWISKVEVLPDKNNVKFTVMLSPSETNIDDIIIERGNAGDEVIEESSSNTDFIDED